MSGGLIGIVTENYLAISGILLIICCLLVIDILRRRRAGVSGTKKRQGFTGRIPSSSERTDSLMSMVRSIETWLDRIGIDSITEEERKWYNKVKMELESIKKSVHAEDFERARRALGSAELYIKMLELQTAGR
jgi:hypothetical protein